MNPLFYAELGVIVFRVPLSNLFLLKKKHQTSEKQRQEKRQFHISVPEVHPLALLTCSSAEVS